MFFVVGVADRFEEVAITPRAATILGRAGSLSSGAPRVSDLLLARLQGFDDDEMFPRVAEIVFINDAIADGENLIEASPFLVGPTRRADCGAPGGIPAPRGSDFTCLRC